MSRHRPHALGVDDDPDLVARVVRARRGNRRRVAARDWMRELWHAYLEDGARAGRPAGDADASRPSPSRGMSHS